MVKNLYNKKIRIVKKIFFGTGNELKCQGTFELIKIIADEAEKTFIKRELEEKKKREEEEARRLLEGILISFKLWSCLIKYKFSLMISSRKESQYKI